MFRVAVTAPNLEEIVVALGLEENIVGVGLYSSLSGRPVIAGMRVNMEKVVTLAPTHLFLLDSQQVPTLSSLTENFGISLHILTFNSLHDVIISIRDIGNTLYCSDRADEVIKNLNQLKGSGNHDVRGLYILWWRPIIVSGYGQFTTEILELSGFKSVYAGSNPFPSFSVEDLLTMAPEAILYSDEAGPPPDILHQLYPGPVIPIEADLLNRPGPALIEAFPQIVKIISNLEP